jgi:hypothetical protein
MGKSSRNRLLADLGWRIFPDEWKRHVLEVYKILSYITNEQEKYHVEIMAIK